MTTNGLNAARRLVLIIAGWQFGIAIAIALALWAGLDLRAGYSALLGGAIAAASSASMAVVFGAFRADAGARRLMNGFIFGELLKLAVTVGLFAAVILTVSVAPVAMLGTYVAGFVIYWIVLIKATSKLMP